MTADSAWDVQTALYTRLTGASALTALLARGSAGIRDHVPEGAPFPYVVLGPLQAAPLDTQGGQGRDITITLQSYSRGEGMKELRGIMAALTTALHDADFTVAGQTLVLCRETSAETHLDADGITREGAQRFRIVTEPAS